MWHERKNKDWEPNASITNLRARAKLLSEVRNFFEARNILEVETPLLCRSAATDPQLKPISVRYINKQIQVQNFYLQTSPEFAMKRLLCAGSGPIYQIGKAFRDDEIGRLHNPEFTLLEWYRPGFDHHVLMDEVNDLLMTTLKTSKAERFTYNALFSQAFNINPHQTTLEELKEQLVINGMTLSSAVEDSLSVDDCLDLLMTHCIEPQLGFDAPVMIYDYPITKAALAKIRSGNPSVAERFEVYVKGIELANGYHELTDPEVQWQRCLEDNKQRTTLGLAPIAIDVYLLEALKSGLPASAGVALGFDRLLMLKLGSEHIKEVIAFTIDRA